MTNVLQELVLDIKTNKCSDLIKIIPENGIIKIWERVSSFIESQMRQEKGVHIPGLGTFTFCQQKIDVGNGQYVLIQRPVFQLLEKFAQTHGLVHTRQHITGQIPVLQLNYSVLSTETGYDRDTVERCIHEVLLVFARSLYLKKNVDFQFSGIGRLQIRHSKVKMKFFKNFVKIFDHTGGKLLSSMQDRPGTADSIMSDRPPSRPRTSNTCHLPKDLAISDGHQNIASCINLPSIQEEGTEINYHNINNDALCSANVEQQDESSNSDLRKQLTTSTSQRFEVPLAVAQDLSIDNEFVLSREVRNFNCDSINKVMKERQGMYNDMSLNTENCNFESEPVLNEKKINLRETITSPCSHTNAGQELCYLCHQRCKRNKQISFSSEMQRAESAEDHFVHQYQQLKDVESLLKEQEEIKKKFHESQKVAAFNQGIAEANKLRKSDVTDDCKSSFLMNHRALTPPKFVKQDKYFVELTEQIKTREEAEKKKKADEIFLERLERSQIEENNAARKEQENILKAEQRETYQKGLASQIKQKSLVPHTPSNLHSEPYFGRNDINHEKFIEKRRLAYELYKEQLAIVEQQKREAILRKLQEQQMEQAVINQAKKELLEDRSVQYMRRFKNRKKLELDWLKASLDKKDRDSEETIFAKKHSHLLHDQCDIKRCDQCKRKLDNFGETNIWCDTRYISGTKVMV